MPRRCAIIPASVSPFGAPTFVCGSAAAVKRCAVCGVNVADYLCDYVVGKRSKTCDKPLCHDCRVPAGPDRDYCPDHAPFELLTERPTQLALLPAVEVDRPTKTPCPPRPRRRVSE